MSTAPEPRRMVTREMIEAHYKSIMNAARRLLSQGETIHAQDLLSEACSRPYPIPAPAAMPESAGRENVVSWSTEEVKLLVDYFHNSPPQAPVTMVCRMTNEALNVAAIGDAPERIAALEAALHPFTKHNSSEPTVTITVPSAAVTRARALLAEGGTP